VTISLSGLIGSETINSTNTSSFANKNIGTTGKTVTVNSITLTNGSNGGLAANYSISAGQTTTANIIAKDLIVSGITSANKTYDGNTIATLDLSSINYGGLVSGDNLTGIFSGTFVDKNVASGKQVNISSTYSGIDINNYNITSQLTHFGDILIASPVISGLIDQTKNHRDLYYTLAGIPSITGLPITYSSSNTAVATVDQNTGAVTIVNVGDTTISANIISTFNYNAGSASYLLVVTLNSTNVDRIAHDTIRNSKNITNNGNSIMRKQKIVSSQKLNPRNFSVTNDQNVVKAKVIISRKDEPLTVGSFYNGNYTGGEDNSVFVNDDEKEVFEEPGTIIKTRKVILKVGPLETYNFKLEMRAKGIVIKAMDVNSVAFAENNKNLVIKSAITELNKSIGFIKNQIKTIIIDFGNKF